MSRLAARHSRAPGGASRLTNAERFMLPTFNQDLLVRDLSSFLPELILCSGIVVLLLMRLFTTFDRLHLGVVALATTLGALAVSLCQGFGAYGMEVPSGQNQQMFGGLLVFDMFTVFLRCFLLSFTALTIWLTLLTGIPDREDSADFH